MSISPIGSPIPTPSIAPAPQPIRAARDRDHDADDQAGMAMRNAALSDGSAPAAQPYQLQSETDSSSGHVDVRA